MPIGEQPVKSREIIDNKRMNLIFIALIYAVFFLFVERTIWLFH